MRFSCSRLIAGALLLLSPVALQAMSVIPPTLDQLVTASDFIVRGVVTDVHSATVETSSGQAIETLVTLHVEKTLKGSPGSDVTLHFLGGKVGHRTLSVHGMPTFHVGDREIVFVANNGRTICPVLAAGHGRYHVRHDAAANREIIVRDNGKALTSTDEISVPLEAATPQAAPALSRDSFETKIESSVRNPRPAQLP